MEGEVDTYVWRVFPGDSTEMVLGLHICNLAAGQVCVVQSSLDESKVKEIARSSQWLQKGERAHHWRNLLC